jgi:hypothetical protein
LYTNTCDSTCTNVKAYALELLGLDADMQDSRHSIRATACLQHQQVWPRTYWQHAAGPGSTMMAAKSAIMQQTYDITTHAGLKQPKSRADRTGGEETCNADVLQCYP